MIWKGPFDKTHLAASLGVKRRRRVGRRRGLWGWRRECLARRSWGTTRRSLCIRLTRCRANHSVRRFESECVEPISFPSTWRKGKRLLNQRSVLHAWWQFLEALAQLYKKHRQHDSINAEPRSARFKLGRPGTKLLRGLQMNGLSRSA